MTYSSTVLADSPQHYIQFSSGTLADDGALARTVTNSGSTNVSGGIAGNAQSFDGVNDSISIANPLDFGSGAAWTFECWFKTSSSSTSAHFIRRDGSARAYLLRLNAGKVEWYCNSASILSTATYNDNQWHHAVGTYSSGTTKLYVDGTLVGSGTGNAGSQGTAPIYLGSSGGTGEWYTGLLDEVAIYNTALTQTQVSNHYSAATAVSISASAPAMVVNVSTPAVIVKTDRKLSAPAMTVNVATPTVTVTAVDNINQTVTPTEDYGSSTGGGSSTNGSATTAGIGMFSGSIPIGFAMKFGTLNLPPGYHFESAILTLTRATVGSTDYVVKVVTNSWDESTVPSGTWPLTLSSTDYGSGTISSGAAGTTFTIDVTDALNAAGPNGIAIRGVSGGALDVYTRNHSTAANRPSLAATVAPTPPAVSTVTGAMELTVNVPQHRANSDTTLIVSGTMSLSETAPAPVVSVIRNLTLQAPAVDLTLEFTGGVSRNPDQLIKPAPFEAWIFSPDANQYVEVPSINTVSGAMEVSLDAPSDVTIDMQTDTTLFVTGPMVLSARFAGGYREGAEDRYRFFLPGTIDADDVWLKMDELAGTAAIDYATNDDPEKFTDSGVYVGGPTLGVPGPRNRRAVHFDGVDDYLSMPGPYPVGATIDMDLTLEFSIKTTDLNGTVVLGGGNAPASLGQNIFGGTADSAVRLVDGKLALYTGSGNNILYQNNKFISDGEWHHVVVSIPSTDQTINAFNISASRQFFMMVDGNVVWARYAPPLWGRSFLPSKIMTGPTGSVEGDMADLVVRWQYAVTPGTAAKLYYEWSESLLVNPEPLTVNISAVAPARARGNTKRMLALYGLPHYMNNAQSFRDGIGTYRSVFAGYYIDNVGVAVPGGAGGQTWVNIPYASNPTPMAFRPVLPFQLEGYMVYPVAVAGLAGSNGGPFSAAGLEKEGARDPITHDFVDNQTGLPRFVDIHNDLAEPVENFDAITAVNYPAVRPADGPENNTFDWTGSNEFFQHNLGLTNAEWSVARDKLRDDILEASYQGVNLWITEPQMAEHLGFISGWVKHETGARVEFYGPGNIDATGYTNKRGEALDGAHVDPTQASRWMASLGTGQYNFTWQANAKRKIVSTEPGLTDRASWHISEKVEYKSDASWQVHADFLAYDVIDRTNGLQVGDEIVMDMWPQNDYDGDVYPAFDYASVGDPRKWIISAYPDGVVGKVISKEMDFYYGPNGVVRANPYRNNVYTIAAERGSVVRGRAIGGRAFLEFMDTETEVYKIGVDRDKSLWNGEVGRNITTWDYDSRRQKNIVIVLLIQKLFINPKTGGMEVKNLETRYFDIGDVDIDYKPHMSMNARGLNWLAEVSFVPEGDVRAYSPSMSMSVSGTDNATTVAARNTTIAVTGAMRMDVALVEPDSVDNPDTEVRALPMSLNIEMRGIGKAVKADPIELTLTMTSPVVKGSGDKIAVYMDAARNVTLFMKED